MTYLEATISRYVTDHHHDFKLDIYILFLPISYYYNIIVQVSKSSCSYYSAFLPNINFIDLQNNVRNVGVPVSAVLGVL